ncbi:class F sortase [Streptosporangium sp. NPDC087985]|uniref:class F sortase n=1 Tax=Streptosporangium sp. NPDC087985 TaxID=3366196 RepID=UPI0037F4C3D1
MSDLRRVTILGLGGVLLLTGCRAGVGKAADPALVRALPVAAPIVPGSGLAVSVRSGGGGWPRSLGGIPGKSRPVAVVVPRAKVNAPVVQIESGTDGTLESPPLERANLAGWDRLGPTPGEPGSAVIVGHLDTRTGPAVFAGLSQVRKGDAVLVTREDRTAVVFRVVAVQRVSKTAFPVSKVYRSLPHPAIRLVTCGGTYDFTRHSYDDNLIVYGDLAGWYRLSDLPRA